MGCNLKVFPDCTKYDIDFMHDLNDNFEGLCELIPLACDIDDNLIQVRTDPTTGRPCFYYGSTPPISEFFVCSSGTDDDPYAENSTAGTEANPLKTLPYAIEQVIAGTSIAIRLCEGAIHLFERDDVVELAIGAKVTITPYGTNWTNTGLLIPAGCAAGWKPPSMYDAYNAYRTTGVQFNSTNTIPVQKNNMLTLLEGSGVTSHGINWISGNESVGFASIQNASIRMKPNSFFNNYDGIATLNNSNLVVAPSGGTTQEFTGQVVQSGTGNYLDANWTGVNSFYVRGRVDGGGCDRWDAALNAASFSALDIIEKHGAIQNIVLNGNVTD